MKKLLAILLVLIIFTSGLTVLANEPEFVRLRVLEAEGAIISWEPATRVITIQIGGSTIEFTQGSNIAYVNGQLFSLHHPLRNIGGFNYIYVPDLLNILESLATHLGNTLALLPLIMEEAAQLANIPGMAVAIVDINNDFVFYTGLGLADTTTGRPVDENTVFNLASISKPFTAIAIMQLVESGLIDLDSPVINYLPDFFVPPCPINGGDYRNITVRMLLTHTSGIQNDFTAGGALTTGSHNPNHLNNLLDNLANYPVMVPENTAFIYNNNAYNVLGVLAATVAGYSDYFAGFLSLTEENIFRPLGMSSTSFAVNENMPLAMGYDREGRQDQFLFYNAIPTGGLNSTAYDMARFMQAVLNGGEGILESETLDYMFAPQEFTFTGAPHTFGNLAHQGLGFHRAYAFGIAIDGFSFYGHNGNLIHYHSDMIFCFDNGLGVFITFNGMGAIGAERIYSEFLLRMAIQEIGGNFNLPPVPHVTPIEIAPEELERLTGIYLFSGADSFATLILTDEGNLAFMNYMGFDEPVTLFPLSDGSFIDDTFNFIFWFNFDYDEVLVQWGHNREVMAGARIDEIVISENFEDFIGVYVPVTEGNHVSLITRIEVGISEEGIPYILMHAYHGVTPIAPIVHLEDNRFLGNIEFTVEGGNTFLNIPLARFVRE